MSQPLVSVITPSHDPTYLHETWASLKAQTYQNFEWLVVANNRNAPVVRTAVERETNDDPRLRVLFSVETGIGALKRYGFERGAGELLAEVDHDDVLTADCLETVVAAYLHKPEPCFIYSDAVTCDRAGTCNVFTPDNGWQHYTWEHGGKEYTINKNFPLTARSLCEILYAPDHIRVWSKEAYKAAGGHDPAYSVGDDHELVVRTFLAGLPFRRILKPLYFHLQDGQTTCQTRVDEIQQISQQTRDRYLYALVKEWCRRTNLPMYDLGGAHGCPEGYIPIDINPTVKQHPDGIRCDVTNLPNVLPPNSVGCFRAHDFLEHIPSTRVPEVLNTLYDLLVPGGWLLSMTPSVCDNEGRVGRGAFQDPTHVSYWSPNNTWYFTRAEQAKYVPSSRSRFQSVRCDIGYPNDWCRQHSIPYLFWAACALKDGLHQPGIVEI